MEKSYLKIDVLILSRCLNADDFKINTTCIDSLVASEETISFTVFIIESNPDFNTLGFSYDRSNVTVIIPRESFNFNRFLNIGLSHATSPWIVFANNDLIFHKGWLTEIFKVKEQNNAIQSFCPFDHKSPYLSIEKFKHKPYHIGYRVPVEFVGWCNVLERSVFEKTGKLDEQFDLYFQDNDFAFTLKKHNILHAMVPTSFVEHLGGYTTKNHDASHTLKYAEDKKKFVRKWGRPSLISRLLAAFKRLLYFTNRN